MMQVKIFNYTLSQSGLINKVNEGADAFEKEVNSFLEKLYCTSREIIDIKITPYTVKRHNGGGYDEVCIQYMIIYKR